MENGQKTGIGKLFWNGSIVLYPDCSGGYMDLSKLIHLYNLNE